MSGAGRWGEGVVAVYELEFVFKAGNGTTVEEILALVAKIKKVHPDAYIRVEVEV